MLPTIRNTMLLLAFSSCTAMAQQDAWFSARSYLWGVGGSRGIGSLDILQPVIGNYTGFFYTNLQTKVGTDNASLIGLGTGYRGIFRDRIFGGYVFVDRDISKLNNRYWVINPGIETLGTVDFRANGYYVVNRKKNIGPTFPEVTGIDDCATGTADPQFVEFHSHQQYIQRFTNIEEVGPGCDAEIGVRPLRNQNFSLNAGGYFYRLKDLTNIGGVEGRVEIPVNNAISLTVQGGYDKVQRTGVVAGIRIKFGHTHVTQPQIYDRLYDPVVRDIGAYKTGSGIPVERATVKHLILERDNITFFSSTRGLPFVDPFTSGTFENPLSNDQFTQNVINQLGPGANLYFNTGTYIIQGMSARPVPNSSVLLLQGQSIFGRTLDFRQAAVGAQRPTFLGEIDFSGYNTLASIILKNNYQNNPVAPSTDATIAIQAINAPDNFICNCEIDAITTLPTTATSPSDIFNGAVGIVPNNSGFTIETSVINADAEIIGNNTGNNIAQAIGNSPTVDIINNTFTIDQSVLNANAIITQTLEATVDASSNNFASDIGSTALTETHNFTQNNFVLTNSILSASAVVDAQIVTTINQVFSNTVATAIGNNNYGGTTDFSFNNFIINNVALNSYAAVMGTNTGGDILAAGIGNNVELLDDPIGGFLPGFGPFNNNTFAISNTVIAPTVFEAAGLSNLDTIPLNWTTAIGNNSDNSQADFFNNTFNLINVDTSLAAVNADVGTNNTFENFAKGIGNNRFYSVITGPTTNFNDNQFSIVNSQIGGVAVVDGSDMPGILNSSQEAAGISIDFDNSFNVINSTITATATVVSNNLAGQTNSSVGVFADNGSVINIYNAIVNSSAVVLGMNFGTDSATGLSGTTGVINIDSSTVNVLAQASPITGTATGHTGNVNSTNTTYNVVP